MSPARYKITANRSKKHEKQINYRHKKTKRYKMTTKYRTDEKATQ